MNTLTRAENEALFAWLLDMVKWCKLNSMPTPPHDTMLKLTMALKSYGD